jgi:hypothetical protein
MSRGGVNCDLRKFRLRKIFWIESLRQSETTGIIHNTIGELKRVIRDKFATINQELLRRVFYSFENRLRKRVAKEGGHLKVINK